MDSKLFRLPTKPNLYAAVATANPFDLQQQNKYAEIPTQDSRYPGWAAPMSDGRLVTSYQNHCSRNVPTGRQFATKEWMTKNAAELIQLGRTRAAQQTGAQFRFDNSVVPPAAMTVKCQAWDCERTETAAPGGIGVERVDGGCPDLFGTWDAATAFPAPTPHIGLTRRYEGGRNTPRGARAPVAEMR